VPRDDLLLRYAEYIRAAAPDTAGFVGLTKLPDPQDAFSMAVKLLRVTDFWAAIRSTDQCRRTCAES
jgi:hypothetical protein